MTLDAPAPAPAAATDAARLHVLRLALDLQVDTLLFTVSAASAGTGGGPVWRRWLTEDLAAVLELAHVVAADDATLPAGLAGAHDRSERAMDDLRARYLELLSLVSEADAAAADPRHSQAAWLTAHYRARLQDLLAVATEDERHGQGRKTLPLGENRAQSADPYASPDGEPTGGARHERSGAAHRGGVRRLHARRSGPPVGSA